MYRKKTAGLLAGWLFGFVLSLQAQLHPKLIVVVVVDQMRADYLDRFASYEHGGLHFLAPIHVGEVVELQALVIRTGRTSMDIAVDVYAVWWDPDIEHEIARAGKRVCAFHVSDWLGVSDQLCGEES